MTFKTLSDYFDEYIQSIFGTDFFSLLKTDPTAERVVDAGPKIGDVYMKKVYTDLNGTRAEMIWTYAEGGTTRCKSYVNGKEVQNLPEDVKTAMQLEFKDDRKLSAFSRDSIPPKEFIDGSPELLADLSFCKTGELEITISLPGVNEDRVELQFSDNYLRVLVTPSPVIDKNIFRVIKGIPDFNKGLEKIIYIDVSKFDITGLEYTISDGLWHIKIPAQKQVRQETLTFKKRGKSKAPSSQKPTINVDSLVSNEPKFEKPKEDLLKTPVTNRDKEKEKDVKEKAE